MIRKTLYELSWQVSETEYRQDKAYSYSTLAKFHREGFNKLESLFDKVSTPSLIFGSVVDTLLTDGEEAFNERFVVADIPVLSDSLLKCAQKLFEQCSEEFFDLSDIPDDTIAEIGKECEYYAGDKYKAYRVKMIKENCTDYYNIMFLAKDKELISTNMYQDALNCIHALRNSDATEWYFKNDEDDGIERFYQLKFKGSFEDINVRCMMDLGVVDHNEKKIYPCDLKTSSKPEWEFHKSFIQWCYYIQAQLYWEILKQNLEKDPIYKEYTLMPYRFIVVNKSTLCPLVWEFPETASIIDIPYGENKQYKMQNWRTIVKELHYYMTETPKVPAGISSINNITWWLNND